MRRLTFKMRSVAVAATMTLLLTACNLAPTYKTPDLPVPETISAQANPVLASDAALQQAQALQWLQAPQLREVVALALTHNRDLRIAIENIEKARAQYGITRAD
ncbi:MAG: transporter, partial [Comamonas sp.]